MTQASVKIAKDRAAKANADARLAQEERKDGAKEAVNDLSGDSLEISALKIASDVLQAAKQHGMGGATWTPCCHP